MKQYSLKELLADASERFEKLNVDKLYATNDGQYFINENRALLHAGPNRLKVFDLVRGGDDIPVREDMIQGGDDIPVREDTIQGGDDIPVREDTNQGSEKKPAESKVQKTVRPAAKKKAGTGK